MHIAYIVLAHQYPDQLARLINRLNTETASFFIHLDRKAGPSLYHRVVREFGHLPNVYLLRRHHCYWGEWGHVSATIEGIKALVSSGIPFDYAILLTGQCYPLRANQTIEQFLQAHQGYSFMEYFSLPTAWLPRIERWYLRFFSKKIILPNARLKFMARRKVPDGFKPFGGSSYWCLSRACIEYLHDFVPQHRRLLNFFRFTWAPDEMIFQTILLNSPLRHTIVNDSCWYISWLPAAASPQILNSADFAAMMDSPKLFARKFDATQNAEILDKLDQAARSNLYRK
ncbi:MAG: beta-1,6-N-acetylglucosaminyltransferase [Leptolyngbya sp. BL-A-14]